MKSRVISAVVLSTLLAILLIGQALAAGQWFNYNVTIPWLGGWVTTNNVTKVSNKNARIDSQVVNSTHVIYGIVQKQNGTDVSGQQSLWTGARVSFPLTVGAGTIVHLKLANCWTCTDTVVAWGRWSPDNPAW